MIRAGDSIVNPVAGDPMASTTRPRQLGVRICWMEDAHDLRRAWVGGYRRAEVDAAFARAEIERDRMQLELDAATQRATAMQVEVRELHDRVDALRQSESSLTRSLDLMRARREQMDREARHRAQELVLEAEERVAVLKVDGLRQVGELQAQVEQLLGMRAGLTQAMQRLSEDLAAAMARLAAAPATAIDFEPEDQLSRWDREQ